MKPGCKEKKKSSYEEKPKVSLKEMFETDMARNRFSICKIKSSLSESKRETDNMIVFYISIIHYLIFFLLSFRTICSVKCFQFYQ